MASSRVGFASADQAPGRGSGAGSGGGSKGKPGMVMRSRVLEKRIWAG
jgi:hypothetical protein